MSKVGESHPIDMSLAHISPEASRVRKSKALSFGIQEQASSSCDIRVDLEVERSKDCHRVAGVWKRGLFQASFTTPSTRGVKQHPFFCG